MKRILVATLLVLFLAVLSVTGQEVQTDSLTTLEDALGIFGEYDIVQVPYDETGRQRIEEAINIFKQTLGVPEDIDEEDETAVGDFEVSMEQKEIVNKLSQAYYTLANVFVEDVSQQELIYLKGKHWGLRSLRMNPDFVAIEGLPGSSKDTFIEAVQQETDLAALYWASSNWLRVAQNHPLAAVAAFVPNKTDVMTQRCLELDETYLVYGGYRALGAFWTGLPRMPFGHYRKNYVKSLCYLCKVVEHQLCQECQDCEDYGEFDPAANEYLENRTFFAEFYLMERSMWEEARIMLEEVLEEDLEPYPLMNAYAQENARQLLSEVEEHL